MTIFAEELIKFSDEENVFVVTARAVILVSLIGSAPIQYGTL